jgi:hypothetical protein
MPEPPPCTALGQQCRELDLTLRIADLTEDSESLQDAAATWLLGHTAHMTFGRPYLRDTELLVDVTVHVPCKHLRGGAPANGQRPTARCGIHGFAGTLPRSTRPVHPSSPRRANGRFRVFYKGRERTLQLTMKRASRRALPVLSNGHNPCAGAPCRTADNTRGAACCRDLTLDVVIPKGTHRRLELLLRNRKPPYLCKVSRSNATTVECEVISACAYLDPADDVSCSLHDRLLPNGRPAKPSICREWPDPGEAEVTHPGCRLAKCR